MGSLKIFGQEIIQYVTNLPDIVERKTFKKDLLITNSFDFTVKNINNLFSANNQKSLFANQDWLYSSITYYNDDNILVWDGIITNIKVNQENKTTTIITKDKLAQIRSTYIEYQSSDWETGADAVKNLMDNYDYDNYDKSTINSSIALLESNNCYLKCNFNKSDNITLFQAINKLAIYSNAYPYSHLNNLYFQVWQKYTGSTSLQLNVNKDTRLKTAPIIEFDEASIINDYDIDYDGSSSPLTDTANYGLLSRNKYGSIILEPMRSGTGKQIVFKDVTSAKYTGEKAIEQTHYDISGNPRQLIKININIDIEFKYYITIGSYFGLTLIDENWDNKIFEVFEFKRSESKKNINITAYEVTI